MEENEYPVEEITQSDVNMERTLRVVEAFLVKNNIGADQLPVLITNTYNAIVASTAQETTVKEEVQEPVEEIPVEEPKPEPAVPVNESVRPDYIICLEDGKRLKVLKRHLRAKYNMSPEEYRAKWGLSPDYPMVAPNYALSRSDLAKKLGLGRKPKPVEFEEDVRGEVQGPPVPEEKPATTKTQETAKRGSRKKTAA